MKKRFDSAPFFWTEQYGLSLRYVGHASHSSEAKVEGDLADRDAIVRYCEDGHERAAASLNRDRENLEDELRLENGARTS